MEDAVEARLLSAICVMTTAQRAAVRAWVDFLLNFEARSYAIVPTLTQQHVTVITMLAKEFHQIDDYLTMIQTVEKDCPPSAV